MAAKLTRQVIVDAAFDVLDDVGIDGLTVRALATRLGVKAPALYWHVESKQALLDEMGTEVARRIAAGQDMLPADVDLDAALRRYAATMRAEYLRHRDGARTFSGTRLTDPEVLRRREVGLAELVSRGVSIQRITDAFEIITSFVVGFVIEEQERSQSDPRRYALAERDAAVGADHPLTIESGHYLFRSAQERFDGHLDVLIPAVSGE